MMDIFSSPFGGIFGIIHLVLFIYALVQIISSHMDILQKIVWILIVGVLPVIGLVIYLLVGNKS